MADPSSPSLVATSGMSIKERLREKRDAAEATLDEEQATAPGTPGLMAASELIGASHSLHVIRFGLLTSERFPDAAPAEFGIDPEAVRKCQRAVFATSVFDLPELLLEAPSGTRCGRARTASPRSYYVE